METMTAQGAVRNRGWFRANTTDAALVFVHGVLSDNQSAWRDGGDRAGERAAYWPDLIGSDNRFRDIAIFLGGYHTAIDAGPYGIRDCASEVFHALNLVDSGNRRPPMDKDKIVFVCHSLGGIVARYVLTEHHAAFASKRVGLFLIASPSYGSTYASTLHRISELYSHQQGRELAYRSWALDDLDARFRALLDERRIPNLY